MNEIIGRAGHNPHEERPAEFIDVSTLVVLEPFRRLAEERLRDEVRILANNNEDNGNVEAWQRWALNQKALVDVSTIDTTTTVLGHKIDLPVIVAPFALQSFCHPEAEVATARGARHARTILAVSLSTSRPYSEVAAAAGTWWAQLQFLADRGLMREIIEEAAGCGASALCLTVDLPVQMWWPEAARRALSTLVDEELAASRYGPFHARFDAARLEAAVKDGPRAWDNRPLGSAATWDDFDWLRGVSPIPIVMKGILNADDAVLAADHGATAIVVSNHGGHGLAQARPTAEALPEIVEAVDGRLEVLVDGGIRDAADVCRSIALGARAVLIGRLALWGLVVGGAEGVARVLELLRGELEVLMGMTGARTVAEIDLSRIVERRTRYGR